MYIDPTWLLKGFTILRFYTITRNTCRSAGIVRSFLTVCGNWKLGITANTTNIQYTRTDVPSCCICCQRASWTKHVTNEQNRIIKRFLSNILHVFPFLKIDTCFPFLKKKMIFVSFRIVRGYLRSTQLLIPPAGDGTYCDFNYYRYYY